MEESTVSIPDQVDLTSDDCNVKDEIETANAEKQPECVNLDSSDDSILINSEIDKVEKATAEEIEAKKGVDIDAKVKKTPSENEAIDNPAKLTNEPDTFEVNLHSPPDKIATPSKSIKKDPINLDPIDLDQINSPDTFDEKSEAVEQNEDILSISSEIEMSDETENLLEEHHEKISLEKDDENVEENAVKNAKENVEENAELDAKMNVEVDAEKNAKENAEMNAEVDAEEDAKMSVVQDVEKNVKENAEENAKKDAEENAEMNVEEDAEENAGMNVEENAEEDDEEDAEKNPEENAEKNPEKNAEENAEKNAEEDAEKNAEEDAEKNAEEDDEEDAEKNPEGDAEKNADEDAEMNVEKKMYKNVEVNAEDAPIDNSEMNELNIDEQIMESKATNADDPRDTDKENNDDDEDDDDYDDDAESNQVMEVDKARSVSPTDSVNSKDTFNSEKTDENKSDSKTEADDTTETEAVIFVELDKDDNLNFEKDTDDKCDIDPLEQLNMANGTNGDEENTKDKLNEPIEREIIAQDDDPLSDGKAVSITTAETSKNLKADKEMVDDIVMIITDSEDEEESQAATKTKVEEILPEKELPPKENDTKNIEPIKQEDVAKPTQLKNVDDVIMVDVDPLDITSKNKKLENIPESQIEATKLKDLEPAKTDEKANEIPSIEEIAPEKKTEKEKIVDDDIIMLDEDDDELPEKSDQTEEIAPVNLQAESKIDGQNKDTNNITENIKESINKLESNSVKQQAPASSETTSSSSTPSTPTLTSSAAASNPLTNEPTQPTASVEKPSTPPKKQSPVAPTQSIVASKQLSATPIPPPLKEIETLLNKFPTNDSTKMESKKRGKLPEKPSDNKVTKTSSGIVKECVNFECTAKRFDNFIKAPIFVLSHFNVPRKFSRTQYVCVECFDKAIESYSRLAGALLDEQPLLLQKLPKRTDLVEILDSSDEEDAKAGRDIDGDECLSSSILATLEEHFDTVFRETIEKVNLTQQMDWTMSILDQKVKRNEEMSLEIDQEIKSLQKMADSMYRNLYKNSNYVIEDLPPFDLNTNKQMQLAGPYYPPFGELQRAPLDTVSLYYAVRQKMLAAWIPCKMMEPMTGTLQGQSDKCYKVKFLRTKGMLIKCVPQNHIAYGSPPSVRLQVGERVIALFQMETPSGVNKENSRALFFPGVIAEPLQAYNRWRYLVFFDDGYAQYVSPDNVRVIVGVSQKVWEDVHPDSANFIENYLTQYKTQRPMVQVRKGQRMITEWNSKWLYAKVNEIDSSLVQMYFEEGKRNEWIYRGSTRLGPLFRERQQAQQKHSVGLTKRNEPYVEYMSLVDDDGKLKNLLSSKPQKEPGSVAVAVRQPTPPLPPLPATSSSTSSTSSTTASIPSAASASAAAAAVVAPASSVSLPSRPAPTTHNAQFRTTPPITHQQEQQTEQQQQEEKRAVAKKSASAPARPQIQHMNNSTIYVEEDNRPKGKVVYYTAKKHMPPRKYVPHTCNTNCLYEVKHNLSSYSPLAKPLLSGWERQICKSKTKKVVMYRAPCGRRLRSMSELHQYLRMTSCPLNVENFDFDYLIHCLAEYVIDSCIMQNSDISGGAENMVVPCVNYYDNTTPPPCIYSAKRIPTEGVNLNLDKEFLCGCDCEDDCLDKMKCQCWQLTLAGAKFGNPNTPPDQVGYEFKRLPDPVPTGIYECNSKCRCARTCLNRVAQQPLQMKLQVFKTGNRGWGLRCLNDVPKGSFICIYAGDLLTEQNANEAGDNYGDEYFAELDYIEVVESLKEGYEPDVVNDDDFEDEEYDADRSAAGRGRDTDDDEFVSKTQVQINKTRYNTRNSDALKRRSSKSSDNASNDEEEERPTLSFVPNPNAPTFDKEQSANKYKSIRKFYGKNEFCYIMDAKKTGNIGRYFNHSCSPNLFVQNVFVDTHDLRFPWVAFFALSHIRAGTELTWNYNYDVGSVPGKVLYCQCGSESCRGRLL